MGNARPRPPIPRPTPRAPESQTRAREPSTVDTDEIEIVAMPIVAMKTPPPLPATRRPPPPPPAADGLERLHGVMKQLRAGAPAPIDAARGCLEALVRAIPCRAALAYVYDVETNEYVVIDARGIEADRLMLTRHPDSDPLLGAASFDGRPIVFRYGPASPHAPAQRHLAFGAPRELLVAASVSWGRALAAFELIDRYDGRPFDPRACAAVDYVAGQLTELMASRGVVLGFVVKQSPGARGCTVRAV